MTFSSHSSAELVAGAIAAKPVALVSFDVFDTLLMRTTSPDFALASVANRLATRLGGTREAWLAARRPSVRIASEAAAAGGFDHEARIEEILGGMARAAIGRGLDDGEMAWALDQELTVEASLLAPNGALIGLARRLKESGVRTIAVSDMYLGSAGVLRLLAAHGAGDVFGPGDVYVSSDHRLSKASGRLYGVVAEREHVSPAQMLHVGDNASIDGRSARRQGVRSVVVPRAWSDLRTAQCAVDARLSAEDPSWHGFAAHAHAVTALRGGLHDAMAVRLAPVLCHFVRSVAERAVASGQDSVWFLAREGFLLKALYETLSPGVPGAPPAGYLAVSRKAVFAASQEGYGVREAAMAKWNGEGSTLAKLLVPLGLGQAEVDALARAYGFAGAEEEIRPWEDPRFHRLAGSGAARDAARARGDADLRELEAYLEVCGFMGRSGAAVVDVGWAGQIQECIEMALARMARGPRVKGYYLALRGMGTLRRAAGLDVEGILFDPHSDGWAEGSPLFSVDIYEDVCRAPHGSIDGYAGGVPRTVAEDRPSRVAESARDADIARMQDAILRYARAWASYMDAAGAGASDAKAMAATAAARVSRLPCRREVAFYREFGHALNFGTDVMVASEGVPSIWRPLQVLRSVYRGRWKEGMAALTWGLPLQIAVAVRRRRVPPETCCAPPREDGKAAAGGHAPLPDSPLLTQAWQTHRHLLALPALSSSSPRGDGLGLLGIALVGVLSAVASDGRGGPLVSARVLARRQALVGLHLAKERLSRLRYAAGSTRRPEGCAVWA